MTVPAKVKLVEVGPRDGLQNEKQAVPASVKIELVHRLQAAGLTEIEVTSYVSPKWVPQMADNAEVMAGIARSRSVRYSVLTPNMQGLKPASQAHKQLGRTKLWCLLQPAKRSVSAISIARLLKALSDFAVWWPWPKRKTSKYVVPFLAP